MREYSKKEALKLIADVYGDAALDIWTTAAYLRVGSGHEEDPRDGVSYCVRCGRVEAPTADPRFHPEEYVDEAGEPL